jgi:UDP-N-acetyl-D-mannosaminuronic acid dehydrogenase
MKVFGVEKNKITVALTSGKVTIAVYGMGKMGLPLAAVFANAGSRVIGVDINQKVIEEINRGGCPVIGEADLEAMVAKSVKSRQLIATTDGITAAKEADVMIILVPSFLDRYNNPDLAAIVNASTSISQGLSPGDLVILETTVPPRTTRDLVLPILKQSGLKDGEFGLAFCPERTSSGRAIRDITGAYTKIVGGINNDSAATAAAIYAVINKMGVRVVADTTTAEVVKLFEGVYRDVNIALSNELALVCREVGVSPAEVFTLVNEPFDEVHQRHHFTFHQPGAGVGGQCIPVYPHFITKTVKADTSLLKTARKINNYMPLHTVKLILEALHKKGCAVEGANIIILGLAFRGGVKETKNSPAISIVRRLKKLKANVFLYDPLFSREEIEDFGATYRNDFNGMDCAVIVTDHQEFRDYDWQDIGGRMRTKIIVDGRQMVNPARVRQYDFLYEGIGQL